MTFRAKPAVKRSHRPAHEAEHRRTLLLNLGFGVVVLLALLILGAAGFASWYGDHLEALATVNGQSITKDDFRDRAVVDAYRLDYRETQIRQRVQDGRLTESAGASQLSAINTARNTLENDVMERLIDANLQSQLAAQQGLTVTAQQIDDALVAEATVPEFRHLWVIGVRPLVSDGATDPTDQQKADARAKAEKALVDLRAGTPWADVAKQLTDDVYSSREGEVGWAPAGGTALDSAVETALFNLPEAGYTDVIESKDGLYRIGRVSEIDAKAVDQAFQQKIKDQGISLDSYRRAAQADALRLAFNDRLVAEVADQPSIQRHLAEIFIATASDGQEGTGDEVQVRHILYSPNNDPQGAQTLAADDPAWAVAEAEANATYADLQKDPTKFQDIAKASSDDTGTQADGGLLPYYTKVSLDQAFGNAIFADGLVKDQLLAPIKSSFGWHVIQYVDRRKKPADRMADIKAQAIAPGADFAELARTYSESSTSADGGDIGWVAKYQFDSVREIAIFKADVGGLTESITTTAGIYLYKVLAEETRAADPSQATELRATAFSNWYTAERNFAHIVRLFNQPSGQVPSVQ